MLLSKSLRKIINWYAKRKIYNRHGLQTKYYESLFNGGGKNQFEIGDYTYGIPNVHIYDDTAKLKIGKYCSLAHGIEIILGGNHHIDWISTFSFYETEEYANEWRNLKVEPSCKHGDVIIGNDVWIGRNVLILSGANIGDGAVIGAGAVIAGKIPPYAIVVGNPAKILKFRFSPSICDQLLKLKWWDWPAEKVKSNLHLLCSPNIETFISKILISELSDKK